MCLCLCNCNSPLCPTNTILSSLLNEVPQLKRSRRPIEKRRWNTILIVMRVINQKRQNSRKSMKRTPLFLILRKRHTMIKADLPSERAEDSVDSIEDLMWISEIFSSLFSDEIVVASVLRLGKISRYAWKSLLKMLSVARLESSSSSENPLVRVVVAMEPRMVARSRPVRNVMAMVASVRKCRLFLASWNRRWVVLAVVGLEK